MTPKWCGLRRRPSTRSSRGPVRALPNQATRIGFGWDGLAQVEWSMVNGPLCSPLGLLCDYEVWPMIVLGYGERGKSRRASRTCHVGELPCYVDDEMVDFLGSHVN